MKHPTVFEPPVLVASIALALLGVVIGLELLTRVGVTPNTSIIGALLAMGVARVPIAGLATFRSVARQNLLQTVISAATFGGANAVFLSLGLAWLVGGRDLMAPMFIGSMLGMLVAVALLYWLFDSPIYPASAAWPAGVATAECLIAGDQGGRRARLLAMGVITGGTGQMLGVPMDVVGICWIGNFVALAMFAIGLLVRGYAVVVSGVEIAALYIPHGIMVGAGLVALVQMIGTLRQGTGVVSRSARRALTRGFVFNAVSVCVIAGLAGLYADMHAAMLVLFILFAAAAALVADLIVGISAMHAGWFPAFATALIVLVIGVALQFPATPLAVLVGFTASGGPVFADLGFDLKTGWIVRGHGQDPAADRDGRRQQLIAAVLGFAIAGTFAWLVSARYFAANLLPPVDRVYAATIAAGSNRDVLTRLVLWALPGAILQTLGGASRQVGVLFATGLLIDNAVAGWTAIAALGARALLTKRYADRAEGPMYVLAGGLVAGSALTSFAQVRQVR